MRRCLPLPLSILLIISLVGLTPIGAAQAAPAAGPVQVELTAAGPVPAQVTVAPGQTVVWANTSGADATVAGDGGVLDSGAVPDGGAYAAAVDPYGSYHYTTPGGDGWLVVGDTTFDGAGTDLVAGHVPDVAFPDYSDGDLALHPDLLVDTSQSRVVAGFADTATVADANAALAAAGGTIIGGISELRTVLLTVEPGTGFTAVDAAVDVLRADPAVAFAFHDIPDESASVPPASSTTLQGRGYVWDVPSQAAHGDLGDRSNWHLEASQFPAAWNLRETIEQGNPTARTVVADTGFTAHPDLPDLDIVELCQDALLWGDCTTSNGAEHGMHVAGIVGADHDDPDAEPDDTGAGVAGGNPVADVAGVAVIGPPMAMLEDFTLLVDAIEEGRLGDVRVINYSGGMPMPDGVTWTEDAVDRGPVCGPGSHDDGPDGGTVDANGNPGRWCTPQVDDDHRQEVENQAVAFDMLVRRAADAGVMIVTSAGNASADYCVPADQPATCLLETQTAEYNSAFGWLATNWGADPARAAWPNPILTVGAIGNVGGSTAGPSRARMGFSNVGEDVTAPGIMLSTFPGGYGVEGGTSQASPLVAALVGYLAAYDPTLTLDQLRAAVLDWAWTDTTDGAAPRIAAFRSLLSLDGAARALVDVNDPSADGNRRVILGPGGTPAGNDTVRSSRPDGTTDADGTVDMRDFRRFRDAWLARCGLETETGCPTGSPIDLDGPPDHIKFDANLDGCVSTTTSALGTDPTCPTSEVAWPRFDFNGDGEVSRTATAVVPLRPDGTPAADPSQATAMTDLEVLASQFDGDSTGAWTTADLVDLMVSGDITIHADAFFADGADRVTVTAERPDGTSLGLVRLTDPATPGVLTVPDGDAVLTATATYPDASTVDATAEQVTVTPGSDHRVDLCRAGELTLTADDAALDADGADATAVRATLTTCGGTDPLDGIDIDFAVSPSGPGHATVAPTTVTTDAAGQAATTLTAGTEGARYTITSTATLPDGSTTTATVGVAVGGLNVAYVWQMTPTGYTETGSTRWPDPIDPAQPDCTIPGVVDHCIDDYTQTLDGTAGGYRREGTLTGGPDRFLVTETVSGSGAATRTTWTVTDPDGTDPHAGEAVATVQVSPGERTQYAGHDLGAGTTAEELPGAVVLRGLDAVGGLGYHHEQTSDTLTYDPPADARFPTLLPPVPEEIRSSSSGLILDPTNPDRSFRYAEQAGAPLMFPADGPDAFTPVSSCVTLDTSTPMERGYLDRDAFQWTDAGASHLRDPDYDPGDLPMPVGTSDLAVTYAFTAVAYRGGTAPTITLPDCATLTPPTATFDATQADPGNSTAVDFTDASADPDGTIAARLWEFGDGTTSTGPAPTHDYATGGTYDVRLTVVDDDGATATTTQQVVVLPPVTFTVDPAAPDEGRVVTFTDTTDMTGVTRTWDFGDGTATTTGEVATHLYGDDATPTVTLTLTTDGGQSVSATRTLTVANVAPTGDIDDLTLEESTPTSITVRLYDPGDADQTQLDWSLTSSNSAFGPALTGTGGTGGMDFADLPGLPAGTYPLTITVTDKDGGTSTSTATLTVVAGTLPPPPPPGDPVPTCDPTVELDPAEAAQLDLLNDYRADNGLGPVTASPTLTTAADRHVTDMATNEFLDHTGSDGSTLRERADDAGYTWGVGENAAQVPSSGSAADVMAGWRSSWHHNENMLDPQWTVVGIARMQAASGDWYWVNDFGDTDDCDSGNTATNSAVSGATAASTTSPVRTAAVASAGAPPAAAVAITVSDATPGAGTQVTVANRSRAADGLPVAGTLDPGDGSAAEQVSATLSATVTAGTAGTTQTLTFTADGPGGGTAAVALDLAVGDAPNTPPVADHGGDPDQGYGVQRGEGIALDASRSYDPDGTITAYEWDLDADGTFDDATGEAVAVGWATIETTVCGGTCTEGDPHPITLRVTDDDGATATAATTLTVWGQPDFVIQLDPASQPINQGGTTNFIVRVDPVNGFDEAVRLSAPGLPDGWRADFVSTYTQPPQTVALEITAPDDAAEGAVDIVVQGTGGGITHTSDGTAEVVFGLIPACYVTISGTVTDAETGDPIAGANIRNGETTTDAQGRYSLEYRAGGYFGSVSAEKPGYWDDYTLLGRDLVCGHDETIDVDLVRKQFVSIQGLITQGHKDAFGRIFSTGTPLEGMQVSISGSQVTGLDGAYDFDGLALGTDNADRRHKVTVTDPDGVYWRNEMWVDVSADTPQVTAPDLPMLKKCKGVVGGGTVVDDNGDPVEGATVRYWRGGAWGASDGVLVTEADGTFSFDTEEYLYTNNTRENVSFRAYPLDAWYDGREDHQTAYMDDCGDRTDDVILTLTEIDPPPPDRYASGQGTIVDATTGDPIQDAQVTMVVTYPYGWPTPYTTATSSSRDWTDGTGHWSVSDVGAGKSYDEHVDREARIEITADGYHGQWVQNLTVTTGQTTTMPTVELNPIQYGAVEGTVRDIATGQPIEDARVMVDGADAFTDSAGHYRIDQIALDEGETTGTIAVSAYKRSRRTFGDYLYFTEDRNDVVLDAGQTTTGVDFDLLPPCPTATVTGVVVDATNLEPIEGAQVSGWGYQYTDADGRFAFTDIDLAGRNRSVTRTLTAYADGYISASKTITVSCGSTVFLEFGKPNGGYGAIVGTVTDIDGNPLENVQIASEFGGADTTDASGDYRLDNAPLNSDGSDRTWTVTALIDNGLTTRSADVTVTAGSDVRQDFTFGGNAPPTAHSQTVTTDEDTPVDLTLDGTDANADPLTFAIASDPANGTLTGTAPDLTYTPSEGWSGTDTFTFTVDDGQATSPAATVTVEVAAVNDPPTARDQTTTTDHDTPVSIALAGDDPDGDALTYAVASDPANGTLTGTAPDLTYTPEPGWSGTDTFTFTVDDGTAASSVATVTVTVQPPDTTPPPVDPTPTPEPNHPPTARDQTVTTTEDAHVAVTLAGDDPDGDTLAYTVVDGPEHGVLSGTAPHLAYTPQLGWSGTDTFAFTAEDGQAASATGTVTVTVTAAPSDPPDRLGGDDRIGTSVGLSTITFDRATAAVVARADLFPDALAASGLAAELDAPILLTPPSHLDGRVADELVRLGVDTVYLMGGPDALAPTVADDTAGLGLDVQRIGGADRYATASMIARRIVTLGGPVDRAVVALGDRDDGRDAWPDALSASTLVAAARAPMLLVTPDRVPAATRTALDDLLAPGDRVWIAGGRQAVGAGPATAVRDAGYDPTRLAGPDRYATAVAVADAAARYGTGYDTVLLASGATFADALSAGAVAAHDGATLLLTDPDDLARSPATAAFLDQQPVRDVVVIGGPHAVSADVEARARELVAP